MMARRTCLSFGVLFLCAAIVCNVGNTTGMTTPPTTSKSTAEISTPAQTTTQAPTTPRKTQPNTAAASVPSSTGKPSGSQPITPSTENVQTSRNTNGTTTVIVTMRTTDGTTTNKTSPLESTISSIFGPRVLSLLKQATAMIPGLKDTMNGGFGLSKSQLDNINGLVQRLMKSVGTNPTSITDILKTIQSTDLLSSLGNIVGISPAKANPKDTAELCDLINSTVALSSTADYSDMTIGDLLDLQKPLDSCHDWAKPKVMDGLSWCANNFTYLKLTKIPPGMVHNPYKWNKCQADLRSMFMGLTTGEQWVLQMLDATAKPGSSILRGNLRFMGNYKQCQDVSHQDSKSFSKIEGNICRASIKTGQKAPPTMGGGEARIEWDLCLPKDCTDTDLNLFFLENNLCDRVWMTCTKEFDMSGDGRAIGALSVLTLFGLLLIAGTVMEFCLKHNKSREKYHSHAPFTNGHAGNINQGFDHNEGKLGVTSFTEANGKPPMVELNGHNGKPVDMNGKTHQNGNNTHNEAKDKPQKEAPLPRWQRALLAFSIPRNTEKILSVKSAPGTIGCLHGIRVLSIGWVVIGHVIIFQGVNDNPMDKFDLMNTLGFQLIINAPLSVDTFFVMSGLLTCYLFLKTLGKKGKITPKEFVMYYVHRYWRLTPSLMIWIMIVACLLKYVGEGRPAWSDYLAADNCKNNWWINLLYINNVYKQEEACVGVTWFLAHDMQFYIVAPLAMIPWVYGKKVLGFLMALVLVSIHLASTIWLEVKYNADMLRNQPHYSEEIYFKPYTRVAPFAIGLMMGWVLWKTKCKVRMNKGLVFLGWMVCFGLILTLTLATYDENKDAPASDWSHAGRLVFETLRRPLWAMAISWIVFACATGYGGYVNSILAWEGWLPLSRLTYSVFLIHLTILGYESMAPEYKTLFTLTSLSYSFIGYFVMSYAVGYILTVAVESPMLALEKVVLG